MRKFSSVRLNDQMKFEMINYSFYTIELNYLKFEYSHTPNNYHCIPFFFSKFNKFNKSLTFWHDESNEGKNSTDKH